MHRCTNVCVCFPRHFPPLAPPTLRGWEVVGRGGKGVGSARHAQVHDHAPIGIKGRSPDHEGGRLHGEPLLRSTPPGCHAELPPATQPRKCWKDHAPSRVVPERVSVRGSCVKLLEHQKPRTVCQHASKMKPPKHRGFGGLTAPKPRGAGAWALLPTRGQQGFLCEHNTAQYGLTSLARPERHFARLSSQDNGLRVHATCRPL
jgi:hypothetical protein